MFSFVKYVKRKIKLYLILLAIQQPHQQFFLENRTPIFFKLATWLSILPEFFVSQSDHVTYFSPMSPKQKSTGSLQETLYFLDFFHFSSVQLLSYVRIFATPWTAACQASLSITNSWSLLKLMSIEPVMPSNHLILCCLLLLLASIMPSIRVFSSGSVLHIRWLKYQSFSFSISHSNEHSGLISFRIDWLDLLAVQGTLKSLLQHHNLKASVLQCSAFFYSPTLISMYDYWKNHTLTRWTFVSKVMSLLFNMLST